jgi:hypothetical protein
MRPIIVALSVFLVCAAASAGEVYKWKDQDGRVHYGDRPKHDAEAVNVEPGSGTGVPTDAEASRQAREAECQKKKAQLENYRRAPSISEIDNLGKQREYTPAEREQFLAMTEKKVAEACAPPADSTAGTPEQAPAN